MNGLIVRGIQKESNRESESCFRYRQLLTIRYFVAFVVVGSLLSLELRWSANQPIVDQLLLSLSFHSLFTCGGRVSLAVGASLTPSIHGAVSSCDNVMPGEGPASGSTDVSHEII